MRRKALVAARSGALLVVAISLAAGTKVSAATIDDVAVSRVGQRYYVDLHATLNISATASYNAMCQVDMFPQLSSTIRRVEILERHSNCDVRMYVEAYLCVLWYCNSVHDVQDLVFTRASDGGNVVATILPERSDFSYGHTEWIVTRKGVDTDLHIYAVLEPAFNIPPVIGPLLLKHVLRMETERIATGIERLGRR